MGRNSRITIRIYSKTVTNIIRTITIGLKMYQFSVSESNKGQGV